MTKPVNLNKVRKARAKLAREAEAKKNRAKFGRTKADRDLEAHLSEKRAKLTESHRLDRDDEKES